MNIKNIKHAQNICAFIYLLSVFINQLKPSHDEIFMIAYGLALIGFVIATIIALCFWKELAKYDNISNMAFGLSSSWWDF